MNWIDPFKGQLLYLLVKLNVTKLPESTVFHHINGRCYVYTSGKFVLFAT